MEKVRFCYRETREKQMAVYFVDLKELGALAADYRMFWTDLDLRGTFQKSMNRIIRIALWEVGSATEEIRRVVDRYTKNQ
ncbi:MAG: hypothetical protein ACTHZ7_09395 [Sphingobacterium sp.]